MRGLHYLSVEVYDEVVELEIIEEEIKASDGVSWFDPHYGHGTEKEWRDYYRRRYDKTYNIGEPWYIGSPSEYVSLPAPIEDQPPHSTAPSEWIALARFNAIQKINKMGKPIIHKYHLTFSFDHACVPDDELDKFLGRSFHTNRLKTWSKLWKSDLKSLKEAESAVLGEKFEDPWYADLPGYDTPQGVYISDGEYAH